MSGSRTTPTAQPSSRAWSWCRSARPIRSAPLATTGQPSTERANGNSTPSPRWPSRPQSHSKACRPSNSWRSRGWRFCTGSPWRPSAATTRRSSTPTVSPPSPACWPNGSACRPRRPQSSARRRRCTISASWGVPDSILLKRGALSHEEREQMKLHTTAGAAILANSHSHVLRAAHQIALTHHEWWDGSGYPNRLRGNEIPLSGRIVAVADVFDALTHDRPYKPAWPVEEALAEIERLSGHQFDPQIVQAFATLDHRAVLACRHPRLAVA